ncbi:hypothetical protein CEXT_232041 [Caerostris extrusa]|uniref:Uncharacterized protein n=1 Tax=Caerostris extrusa TaxID=172846 RepID=A0AAV4Y5P5_CAEEX|nr:hypothetical protein CEXT_232041 [Caerostris extrusa]
MAILKIALAILLVIQYDSAMGFGGGLGGGFGGGYGMGAPRPFAMGYQASGGGAASFRSEQGDGSGGVRGSYGYRDAQGLYRMVEYSAGQGDSRPLSRPTNLVRMARRTLLTSS